MCMRFLLRRGTGPDFWGLLGSEQILSIQEASSGGTAWPEHSGRQEKPMKGEACSALMKNKILLGWPGEAFGGLG